MSFHAAWELFTYFANSFELGISLNSQLQTFELGISLNSQLQNFQDSCSKN